MDSVRNARFWVFINGPVKLTLKPGQTLEHMSGGYEDEGWSSDCNTWEHTGDSVFHEWSHDAQDCDGRHGTGGESSCDLGDLYAGYEDDDGIVYPKWSKGRDHGVYDQYAQKMGY